MMRGSRLARWLIGAVGLALAAPAAASSVAVKLATLAPDGSVWEKNLEQLGATWAEATDGRVTLRIYPGGVAGDDPDVVRKMRIGQLHGAALTVAGLSEIDDAFEALSTPLMFDSYEELYAVLASMRADLEQRLEERGFVLLFWGHGGWVHLFSKQPLRTVADLKASKLFVWAGDDERVQLWKRAGFQPVPLAGTDIMTGLQTGLIDVLPTPPLAALSLQWFRQTPYMQNLGLAPLVGGVVISKRIWDRIDAADRAKLLEAARQTEKTLEAEVPAQDSQAVAEMQKRGLEVVEISNPEEWQEAARRFVEGIRGTIAPPEWLDRVVAERDAYRNARAEATP